jgi:hypothetical protein
VIVVRFPSRLALAASVLGVFAAGSGAVLSMPERAEGAAVPVPEITSAAAPQAPAAVEPAAAPGPAITGEQIAALALAPARDRAAALIEEQEAAEAQRARSARDSRDDSGRWRELRDELREACEEGRIRGDICRS